MVAMIKVPFSLGSLGRNIGCEKTPDILVNKLYYKNLDIKEVKVYKNNSDLTHENISNARGEIYLGGDHSLTYSSFRSLEGKNKGLIIFDAHPDLEVGTKSVTHEDYLRKLIDNNYLKKENLVLIGIRKISENEYKFLKENRIKFYTTEQIFDFGIKNICEDVMEYLNKLDSLYLSIDIDVLDPAFAPGTGYREPFGLSNIELLYILKRILKLSNIKRADLVEINPDNDINDVTVNTGAEILKLFLDKFK